jgi:hypothetical protein
MADRYKVEVTQARPRGGSASRPCAPRTDVSLSDLARAGAYAVPPASAPSMPLAPVGQFHLFTSVAEGLSE